MARGCKQSGKVSKLRAVITDKVALDRIQEFRLRSFLSEMGAQHTGDDRWALGGVVYDLNRILSCADRKSRALTLLADSLNLSELDILGRLAQYRVMIYDLDVKLRGASLSWAKSIGRVGSMAASAVPDKVFDELVRTGLAEVLIANGERRVRLSSVAINDRLLTQKRRKQ